MIRGYGYVGKGLKGVGALEGAWLGGKSLLSYMVRG